MEMHNVMLLISEILEQKSRSVLTGFLLPARQHLTAHGVE
jgi:hypothetical protein